MQYSEDMIKAVCEEMGIEWDDSGKNAMIDSKPIENDFNLKELFAVNDDCDDSCVIAELDKESEIFNCSIEWLNAA